MGFPICLVFRDTIWFEQNKCVTFEDTVPNCVQRCRDRPKMRLNLEKGNTFTNIFCNESECASTATPVMIYWFSGRSHGVDYFGCTGSMHSFPLFINKPCYCQWQKKIYIYTKSEVESFCHEMHSDQTGLLDYAARPHPKCETHQQCQN